MSIILVVRASYIAIAPRQYNIIRLEYAQCHKFIFEYHMTRDPRKTNTRV